ncbi:hypothetical protein J6590_075634 [Homalodisca vitripennis]|nr:hypothetical protein J6590_075634 [Homalodisca vitripennis]
MPTFLIALAVFDFSSTTSLIKKFSSWAIPFKVNMTLHGHRRVAALVEAMESIAGSAFPMPKLDQLALPQLNPVAMENWGLNTYREVNMLYEEGRSAPKARQDIPRFTAHEVCHHWVGNLVRLQWWDWLWISEMYAMYYEYYLPSKIEPSWRMLDQMIVELYIPGLLEDSFNSSRPLTTRVSSNQEILAKFSGVIYTKGPALIHMINNFMTPSRAEQALRLLLQEKKYNTIDPSDLWRIYDRKAEDLPADMATIMGTWTDQPGYPLVTAVANRSDGSVTLRQERFLTEGVSSDSHLWWIPITYTTGLRPNFTNAPTRLWLSPWKPITTVKLGPRIDSWLIFNVRHIGFYRVNYDHENWQKLIDALHSDPAGIHELNRVQLLDDSLSLARAGRLSYTVPLRLMEYMAREGCYLPWAAVLPSINFLLSRLNGLPTYDDFREYLRELIAPTYDSVGFYLRPSDPHLLQMHRVQVVTLACSVGLPSCVTEARRQEQFISQNKTPEIAAGLEFVQLCTVLETGVSPDDLFHQLTVWGPNDQLRAMPCTSNKTLLIRYLTTSLMGDSAADWEAKLMAAVSRLPNVDTVFTLLVDRYSTLLERFGTKNTSTYFTRVGSLLTTNAQLAKVEALRAKVVNEEVTAALRTVSSGLLDRLRWSETHSPTIQSWLNHHKTNKIKKVQGSLIECF